MDAVYTVAIGARPAPMILEPTPMKAVSVVMFFALVFASAPAGAQGSVVTGTGEGSGPVVRVLDGLSGAQTGTFLPYPAGFTGGVRVASGDVDGDGVADVITGTGPGAPGTVKAFSGADNSQLDSFFAYGAGFTSGVYVGAGDVNGDGVSDIVTGAGAGPHVKVFDGATGSETASFFAYATGFSGGVRVAAGDVNGDGYADIVTGTGAGAISTIKVFSGADGAQLDSFFAFGASFSGGVFVAAGDVDGDGYADIVAGADAGGAPQVRVFSGTDGSIIHDFLAFTPSFSGGVRVAAGDLNGDGLADIVAGAGPGSVPQVNVFSGADLTRIGAYLAYGPSNENGLYVAAVPVPEPETWALLLAGLTLVGLRARRSRRAA